MNIYGNYETNANRAQARFSCQWFLASDSLCKMIGFLIGSHIDYAALLVER